MKIGTLGRNLYTAIKNGPKEERAVALVAAGCAAGGALLGSSLVSKKDEEGKKSTSKLTKVLAATAGAVAALFVGKKVLSVLTDKTLKTLADRANKAIKADKLAAEKVAPQVEKAFNFLDSAAFKDVGTKVGDMANMMKKLANSGVNSEEFKQCLSRAWSEYQAFAKKYPSYDKFLREKFGGLLQVIFKVPAK